MRELGLDFRKRTMRGDFENQRGIAEQRTIANCRNECILRALDDLKPDGAPAEADAEEVLQVAHHRPENILEIVLVVGRIFPSAPLRRGECRELADQAQEFLKEAFRM